MSTQWRIRVYTSKSMWWEWTEPTEEEANNRKARIVTSGFRADRPRGKGTRHYLPAGIIWIDVIPPAKKAEVAAP